MNKLIPDLLWTVLSATVALNQPNVHRLTSLTKKKMKLGWINTIENIKNILERCTLIGAVPTAIFSCEKQLLK